PRDEHVDSHGIDERFEHRRLREADRGDCKKRDGRTAGLKACTTTVATRGSRTESSETVVVQTFNETVVVQTFRSAVIETLVHRPASARSVARILSACDQSPNG